MYVPPSGFEHQPIKDVSSSDHPNFAGVLSIRIMFLYKGSEMHSSRFCESFE